MKCMYCGLDYAEELLDESHDVPCYLFEGNRKGQKNQADKFGRRWLCRPEGTKRCHVEYEKSLREFLRLKAIEFSKEYFKEEKNDTTKITD